MTTRIDPTLTDTEEILGEILKVILSGDERASILVPAGKSFHMCARIRTMISRRRAKLLREGKNPRRFKLNSTVHTETHDGKRMECIVFWQEQNDTHFLTQVAEDLLNNV